MNKILLLSRIKGLIFVLKPSTEYITYFIYRKKGKSTKFLFQIKNIFPKRFNVSICYYIFCIQESTFSTVKETFLDQAIISQSRNFSTVKKFLIRIFLIL